MMSQGHNQPPPVDPNLQHPPDDRYRQDLYQDAFGSGHLEVHYPKQVARSGNTYFGGPKDDTAEEIHAGAAATTQAELARDAHPLHELPADAVRKGGKWVIEAVVGTPGNNEHGPLTESLLRLPKLVGGVALSAVAFPTLIITGAGRFMSNKTRPNPDGAFAPRTPYPDTKPAKVPKPPKPPKPQKVATGKKRR